MDLQPKIHCSLIHQIYKIREITGLPMTVIVDHAIREYMGKYEIDVIQNNQANYQDK
jgi:hypothetical protein